MLKVLAFLVCAGAAVALAPFNLSGPLDIVDRDPHTGMAFLEYQSVAGYGDLALHRPTTGYNLNLTLGGDGLVALNGGPTAHFSVNGQSGKTTRFQVIRPGGGLATLTITGGLVTEVE
jgi:hypothetical protein